MIRGRSRAPRLGGHLALSFGLVGLIVSNASAQQPGETARWVNGAESAAELAALGNQLVDAHEARRLEAFHTLSSLPTTAVSSISERFAVLSRAGLSTEKTQAALTAFRRAVGSNRADDNVDLAPGIMLVTQTERSPAIATSGEILLLLRSLEALGTPAAGRVIVDGLAIDVVAFAREAVRVRARLGLKLVPALIASRGHPVPEIRRWAGRGLKLLAATDPAVATEQSDPEAIAATLEAYGSTHDLAALPIMVSLLNDARIQVRSAARDAVRALGRNAIWKVRGAYQEVTGTNANPQWDSEATLSELCLVFDRARIERAETALARGLNAHMAGDLSLMEDQFEQALRGDANLKRRDEMAPGFAALGDARADLNDLDGAQAAYRRAVRLAPKHAGSSSWQAELSFLAAERNLSRGVVDMEGYRGALALHSDHGGAKDAVDRLSGAWSARAERFRRIAALSAIGLLCTFGFGLLRFRRPIIATPTGERTTARVP